MTLSGLLIGVAAVAYNGLLDGGPTGQTIGKRLVRIRVVSDDTGELIGLERGLARAGIIAGVRMAGAVGLLAPLSLLALVLDGLWPLWDRNRQTWHDKAVRSVVVVAERPGSSPRDLPRAG